MSATEPPEKFTSRGGNLAQFTGRISPSSPCPVPYRFPDDHPIHPVTVPEGHDRAAKRLLGDARMIADALRAFVPGSWVSRLDLDTLCPLPTEHMNAELHGRRGDLLWAVDLKGGGTVVIILEAQSTPDPRMAAREPSAGEREGLAPRRNIMTLTGLVCEGLTEEAMGRTAGCPRCCPSCCTPACGAGHPLWT